MLPLQNYETLFSKLKVHITKKGKAPHKIILLLTMIDLIEQSILRENKIRLSAVWSKYFTLNWEKYVPEGGPFVQNMWTPFWHLANEPFWHLKAYDADDLEMLKKQYVSHTAPPLKIKKVVDYAYLDEDLFLLLTIDYSRRILRETLVNFLKNENL